MPNTPVNKLTLRQRVFKSSSWTLVGYGMNQALRLGGNLILTRLLFPEAFGLMAIIQAVGFGVHMLTDVGVGPSIVQKAQGNDPDFLNTAWTIQIVRGLLVCIVLCALAIPMAKLYNEPLLASMIPFLGLNTIIYGFNSTKLHTAQRNLEVSRLTQIEVGTYALGLLCTIFLAWWLQSVWSLVWGSLFTVVLKMIASHLLLHGMKNKFAWNREALDHLVGFGRWIMLNSALGFLSIEGARLLLGALLDMRQLALYTLASTMNLMLWQAVQQLAGRVFFPAYSEAYRKSPDTFSNVLFKSRLILTLPTWALAIFFVFFGSQVMGFLYDQRYQGSGIMLEQLAAGTLVSCIWGSYAGVLLALGKASTATVLLATQILCQVGAIFAGYQYWGGAGIVVGVAAANWIMFPVNAFVMHRAGLWQPKFDLGMLAASALIVLYAWPSLSRI